MHTTKKMIGNVPALAFVFGVGAISLLGLYGVAIGRAFFGESMFSRATDASKVALVHGVEYLRARGTRLIDCQVASAHTRSLGAVDMPRAEFLATIRELCADSEPPRTWRST